jgi:hypothetical protein
LDVEPHSRGADRNRTRWAEAEAHTIVVANIERVERLGNQLLLKRELNDASEILRIIEGPLGPID